MNCREGSENCVASSFVTGGEGAIDGGVDSRGTVAIDHVRPGMASKAAYSIKGGR